MDPRELAKSYIKKYILGAVAGAAPTLLLIMVLAPVGLIVTVVLGNKIGQVASGLACGAESLVGGKSDFCKARDQVMSELSDKEKKAIEDAVGDQVKESLDCSNATIDERQQGLCVTGLLDTAEQNSPVPKRAWWLVPVWQEAAKKYKVPWELIAAVNGARSSFGYINCENRARGDLGFYRMQADAWDGNSVDGGQAKTDRTPRTDNDCTTSVAPPKFKPDRIANAYDAVDATFSEAQILASRGAKGAEDWKYSGSDLKETGFSSNDGPVYLVPELTTGAGGASIGTAPGEIPKQFVPLYNEASRVFNVNPYLIAGIHYEETGFSTNPRTWMVNSFGCCIGPFQMNITDGPPSTWDGVKYAYKKGNRPASYPHPDQPNPSTKDTFDEVMAAAQLLRNKVGGREIPDLNDTARTAARAYNGSGPVAEAYADRVMNDARKWERKGGLSSAGSSVIDSSGNDQQANTADYGYKIEGRAGYTNPSKTDCEGTAKTDIGIAVPKKSTLCGWWEVTLGGRTELVRQTYIASSGGKFLLNKAAAALFNLRACERGFPDCVGKADGDAVYRGPQRPTDVATQGYRVGCNYTGKKITDAVSKAVRWRDRSSNYSDCYIAEVYAWYKAIKENPPVNTSGARARIVEVAQSQVGTKEMPPGSNCQKYGPCVAWCALFATWVWQRAGIDIPQLAYSGDPAKWGMPRGLYHPAGSGYKPQPGDMIFFGSGPEPGGSDHMGLISKVLPNGNVVVISGNYSDAVTVSGPAPPATVDPAVPAYGYLSPPDAKSS